VRGQRVLCSDRRLERLARIGEDEQELVAAAVELRPVSIADSLAEEPPMVLEHAEIGIAELPDQLGGALDVGEEKGDRSGRERRCGQLTTL
jgi:hypothetical protein